MTTLSEYERAFQNMKMPPTQYVMRYAGPMVAGGIVFSTLVMFLARSAIPLWLAPLVPLLIVGFTIIAAVMWPIAVTDRIRIEINDALPFFMTHFGVLSTSNMPRTEIFRILGQKKEYKALSEELNKIFSLVTNWNLSLPQACRFVSKTTPSQIFGDFLERLAHALETGQDLEIFLRNEQSVVMKEYSTVYESSIYQVEQWKEIYASVVMSGVFLVIFAIIAPIISQGLKTKNLLFGLIVFFVLMEVLLMFVLKLRVPTDRLWHRLKIATPERDRMQQVLLLSVGISFLLLVLAPQILPFPLGVNLAIAFTPLAAAGSFASRVEKRVKRREDNYSAFIRSLGASAAAKGGSLREVLRKVKVHNFGPLTAMVMNLYARLTWRLHDSKAWKQFSAESGSNLVDSFNDMFVEGIKTGGKPQAVGEIISDNVVRIMNLRKARYATAGTFRGVLIGLTASMAFVMFTGVGIIDVLGNLFDTTSLQASTLQTNGQIPSPVRVQFDVNVGFIELLLLWLLMFHSFMASAMLKMVDGGTMMAGLGTFVFMAWTSAILAIVSKTVMTKIF